MYNKFSNRIGVTEKNSIQFETINLELRNSLWNLIAKSVFLTRDRSGNYSRVQFVTERFLKLPRDDVPALEYQKWLKYKFDKTLANWWEPYNFIDFLANHKSAIHVDQRFFTKEANRILEEENSGYRFINTYLTPITNPSEIESISKAADFGKAFYGTTTHIQAALELISRKPNPDYRNSIKESISSVESLVRQIANDDTGSFDKALNKLDTKLNFHGAFKKGLNSLYGYTSDQDGIRHAILEEAELDFDDAKYMLVICSAFVNLIVAKANRHGLLPKS